MEKDGRILSFSLRYTSVCSIIIGKFVLFTNLSYFSFIRKIRVSRRTISLHPSAILGKDFRRVGWPSYPSEIRS